ncbi:SGNH hydrolase [Coniochaeta ligniaria NRRL 30616]|uniref:SGNH hydrolase n=1 Tax=Coniochaeta ligniaria NRRL 30616 TaxID=1408157 RepID=A0A1J7I4U1_9PEZI|nr:SGNH hydrolase [Coniochaeta ligniaria NRRL 30616]
MMLSTLTRSASVLFSLLSMAAAVPAKERNPCSRKPAAFFLAGDSTTAIQSTDGGGWSNGFLSFLRNGAWGVNYGHNGATTVSFVAGGDWGTVIGRVKNSTADFDVYVTIQRTDWDGPTKPATPQFGHNDQKAAANISLPQYQTNLEELARQVRSAGGEPILVTPLTRRVFTSARVATDSLHDQRLATIAAGQAVGARVLDLNLASLGYVDAIGSADAQTYNLNPTDMTHLNDWGSVVFGRMVADLLLGHPPVIETSGEDTSEKAAGPDGRRFARWIAPDEQLSWKIWHGVAA